MVATMAAPSDLAARRANVLRNIAVGPPVFSLLLAALYTAALATYLSADTARILPALTVVFFLAAWCSGAATSRTR